MPDVEKIVKVTLQDNLYDPTWGKMRKGGVYEFPQEQAIRYVRTGAAKPAPASAKTARDEDREALNRELKAQSSSDARDAEMAAMWDIEIRDLERAEMDAEAAEDAADAATEAVKRAQKARAMIAKGPSQPTPGEVTSQGAR